MEKRSKSYWESNHPEIPVGNKQILNEYLLLLKQTGRAESTITTYKAVLEKFLRSLGTPLKDIKEEKVWEWLQVFSVDKKQSTIRLCISTLTKFLRYCKDAGYIEKVVIRGDWKIRVPLLRPKFPKDLTDEEFRSVIVAANGLSPRDKAITFLLFSTGFRSGEICSLSVENID